MKMKRKLTALAIAAVLIAGCGSTAGGQTAESTKTESTKTESTKTESTKTESTESAADPAEEMSDEELVRLASGDITAYLTDGAMHDDDVLAEEGGYRLTAAEASFYIAYQYYTAQNYYAANDMTLDLDQKTSDGSTYAEFMRQYAGVQAARMLAGAALAGEEDVALDEEAARELETFFEENAKSHGETRWYSELSAELIAEEDFTEEEKEAWILEKGETAFRHSMLSMGTTPEAYREYAEKYQYMTALQDHYFGEGGAYALSDEELASRIEDYMLENGVVWGRCILFNAMNATEEEAEALKKQAEDALAELQGLSGDELADRFTALQTQYDQSGYTAGEIQMYTNSDSLVPGYYETLAGLAEGETGLTDRTAYGWFVLLREPEQPSLLEDTVRTAYVNETFSGMIEAYEEKSGIDPEKLIPEIDTELYFSRLDALGDALTRVDQVVSAHPAGEESK